MPKTEDELEDDAEMLLNVTDSGLRAQLMSASLLSDMESFKAANPLGKLEDFIRWYSPRDWIEEDTDGKSSHFYSFTPLKSRCSFTSWIMIIIIESLTLNYITHRTWSVRTKGSFERSNDDTG